MSDTDVQYESNTSLDLQLSFYDVGEWESLSDDTNTYMDDEVSTVYNTPQVETIKEWGHFCEDLSSEDSRTETIMPNLLAHNASVPCHSKLTHDQPNLKNSAQLEEVDISETGLVSFMDDEDDDNYNVNSNTENSHHLVKIVKPAFMLKDTTLIGDPKLRRPFQLGWKREVVLQSTHHLASTKKKANVYYIAPSGIKCSSFKKMARFLSDGLQKCNFTFKQALIGVSDEFETFREAKTKTNYDQKNTRQNTILKTSNLQDSEVKRQTARFGTNIRKRNWEKNKKSDEVISKKPNLRSSKGKNAPKCDVGSGTSSHFTNCKPVTVRAQSSVHCTPEKPIFRTYMRNKNFEANKERDQVTDFIRLAANFQNALKSEDEYGTSSLFTNDTPVNVQAQNFAEFSGHWFRSGKILEKVDSDETTHNLIEPVKISILDAKLKKPFNFGWTREMVTYVRYRAPTGQKFYTAKKVANYSKNLHNLS